MQPNQKKHLTLITYHETVSVAQQVKSMTWCILFHLHDNNKGRWPEQTKVIFDVQHQTPYTWRVWHHDDFKLITQQQTRSCCEDKGLASVCFCSSLNQKTLKRKGSHMKGSTCWESTELGRCLSSKRLSHFKSRGLFPNAHWGVGGLCAAAVCLCRWRSFLSVCWPCLSGVSGKVSVSFLHCWWIMRCD